MAIVDIKHTQTIEELASKLEEGGSGGGTSTLKVIISNTGSTMVMDKTWKEIHDAYLSGGVVFECRTGAPEYDEDYSWYSVGTMVYHHDLKYDDGDYYTIDVNDGNNTQYRASSENDYPEYNYED